VGYGCSQELWDHGRRKGHGKKSFQLLQIAYSNWQKRKLRDADVEYLIKPMGLVRRGARTEALERSEFGARIRGGGLPLRTGVAE